MKRKTEREKCVQTSVRLYPSDREIIEQYRTKNDSSSFSDALQKLVQDYGQKKAPN
jgi:hypothetical protein